MSNGQNQSIYKAIQNEVSNQLSTIQSYLNKPDNNNIIINFVKNTLEAILKLKMGKDADSQEKYIKSVIELIKNSFNSLLDMLKSNFASGGIYEESLNNSIVKTLYEKISFYKQNGTGFNSTNINILYDKINFCKQLAQKIISKLANQGQKEATIAMLNIHLKTFKTFSYFIIKPIQNILQSKQLSLTEKISSDNPYDSYKQAWNNKIVEKAKLGKLKFTDLLFPGGKVKPTDINQGRIGDCYILSVAQSLAQSDPQKIKDIFLNADNIDLTSDTPKKLQMRLYLPDTNITTSVSAKKIIVELDPSKVINYGNKSYRKALWPNYIEMATAALAKKSQTVRDILGGGNPKYAFVCLTGETAKSDTINSWQHNNDNYTISKIEKALVNNKSIFCGRTRNSRASILTYDEYDTSKALGNALFNCTHAYSIFKIHKNEKGNYTHITLRNPHGYRQTITINDFLKFFNVIYYGRSFSNNQSQNNPKMPKESKIQTYIDSDISKIIIQCLNDYQKISFKDENQIKETLNNIKKLYNIYLDSLCKNSKEKYGIDFNTIYSAYKQKSKNLKGLSKSPEECYKELIAMSKKEYDEYKKAISKLKIKVKSMKKLVDKAIKLI